MHSPRIDPHQVPRPLNEAVHRNVGTVKVLQDRPPGPCKVVHPVPEGNNSRRLFEGEGAGGGDTAASCYICFWEPLHSLLAEFVDRLPVVLVDGKPFAVTRPDVDVDRAEIVVLLMT